MITSNKKDITQQVKIVGVFLLLIFHPSRKIQVKSASNHGFRRRIIQGELVPFQKQTNLPFMDVHKDSFGFPKVRHDRQDGRQ